MRTPWQSATDNKGLSPVTTQSALAASAERLNRRPVVCVASGS